MNHAVTNPVAVCLFALTLGLSLVAGCQQPEEAARNVSAFSFDKSESFVRDYLFDLALGHHIFLSKMLVNP